MEWIYPSMVVFLFLLAAFDLWVGVSNDAVNFLNSAIGSRAAKFKTLLFIAGIGVFAGCALSNGMMDIARHGIFSPQYFTFREVMLIFLAVMATDIVLLDVFNTFGMPTSTTVSMVFELLGASFAFVIVKMATDGAALGMGDYLNTSKALEVIIGIFMSVPIAFFTGMVVQYLARVLFTFQLQKAGALKTALYGGFALTAILYFMLFKGLKDLSFMNAEVKDFIHIHTATILAVVFVSATLLMWGLKLLRVNVLRVVVLSGTFALATAFAGNDLVNFIGVPLAGLSSWMDFSNNGLEAGPELYRMVSLTESAKTPLIFLIGAGALMVFSLVTSKKARRVVETEVGLSRSDEGDEMFGTSKVARSLVRWGNSVGQSLSKMIPERTGRWLDERFRRPTVATPDAAAYDLCRASVNLCVASLLIALGTTLKLPLSTTFVTFMVAMGSSLSDRAWSRESAVFRITGVLTVIGGWFITAGVAFTLAFFVATAMNFGGIIVIVLIVAAGIFAIIRSQKKFAQKQKELVQQGDMLFTQMWHATDRTLIIPMLERHIHMSVAGVLEDFAKLWTETADALKEENLKTLRHTQRELTQSKRTLKNLRRREALCLRRAEPALTAVKLSTPFHLIHNSLLQIRYGLVRMAEPCLEHVDNHFTPPEEKLSEKYEKLIEKAASIMVLTAQDLRDARQDENAQRWAMMTETKKELEELYVEVSVSTRVPGTNLTAATLLLHLIQEAQQILSEMKRLQKHIGKFHQAQLS